MKDRNMLAVGRFPVSLAPRSILLRTRVGSDIRYFTQPAGDDALVQRPAVEPPLICNAEPGMKRASSEGR